MQGSDRAGEFLRLRDQYRGLSDGELLILGRDPSELTEIAQQVLASEISRRGLKVEPDTPPARQRPEPPPDVQDPNDPNYDEDRKLISLCTVWSLADALQLQDLLDNASIPVYVGPERATDVDGVTSNFAEGVEVQIMSIGLPWARLAMKNYSPADDQAHEKEKVLDEASLRCPKCHSDEVLLEETEAVQEGDSPQHFKWTCDACGYHWEDDGIEEPHNIPI
jgi:DNA-directed RNA polymerase subunit M/transcription elongation factor TFIIS